jgi:hypothetical protein
LRPLLASLVKALSSLKDAGRHFKSTNTSPGNPGSNQLTAGLANGTRNLSALFRGRHTIQLTLVLGSAILRCFNLNTYRV